MTAAKDFVEAAHVSSLLRALDRIEFNSPAAIIMVCDGLDEGFLTPSGSDYRRAVRAIRRNAEISMLQLALLAEGGVDPGSVFLADAYYNGWRYRLDKGFHRLTPEGEIENAVRAAVEGA